MARTKAPIGGLSHGQRATMNIEFVSAQEAACPTLKHLENCEQMGESSANLVRSHTSQPHCSLPCPSQPLSIASPSPIEVHTASPHLNPATIANLWLQLLLIQTQNGNFLHHGDLEGEESTCCITLMTPEQCKKVEELAQATSSPVDRAVVELICMLPYASTEDRREQIAPNTMMIVQDRIFASTPSGGLDRNLFLGGPVIPSHLMQLTELQGGSYGMALFIDTRTGKGIILDNYGAPVKFEGKEPTRDIEDILREWIDNYLELRWIPDGSEDVYEEGRHMHFIRLKRLMEEYGWPEAFPLPTPQFAEFLERKAELKEQEWNNIDTERALINEWNKLKMAWYEAQNDPNIWREERPKCLDGKINEALDYDRRQKADREYAFAVQNTMDPKLTKPVQLHCSGNSGENWSLDVTPEMILERFEEVRAVASATDRRDRDAESSAINISAVEDIKAVLEAAYEQYKNPQKGPYEMEILEDFMGISTEDLTSDYEVSEEERTEDEEFESDGDGDDLDAEVLKADLEIDVEDYRKQLA